MADARSPLRDGGLLALIFLAWGANYLFARVGLAFAPPLWLAGLRSGLGVIGLLAYLLARRQTLRLDPRPRALALILGIPNTALFFGLWFVAAARVPAGVAAVMVYTFPLWVALLSHPVLGHRLERVHWAAVAAGFGGTVLLAQPWTGDLGGAELPLLELLAAAVSWAGATVLAQRWFSARELPAVNAHQLGSGAAILLAAAWVVGPKQPPAFTETLWVALLWLGLYGTAFAYAAWFFLLGRVRASVLASYSFMVPLVALSLSSAFLGERIAPVQGVGVAFVLGAIYFVAREVRGGPSQTAISVLE